ncbi:MAG: hypothetical protein ACC642_11430, partial [Pseudomonadales bacterium]
MNIVEVRVPMQHVRNSDELLIEAVRIYMQCSPIVAARIIKERGFHANRELTQQELALSELTVRLRLPDDIVDERVDSTQTYIAGLSPEMRGFIFRGGEEPAEITADLVDDYAEIARLTVQMSEQERRAYLEQTSVDTTDPVDLARSLEAYVGYLRGRTDAREVRIEAESDIFGVWKSTKDIRYRMGEIEGRIPTANAVTLPLYTVELVQLNQQYDDALRRLGFESREDLEAAMEAFTSAYRDEAVLIAGEALNRASHAATETGSQIEDPATLEALFGALSGAREMMDEARRIRSETEETIETQPTEVLAGLPSTIVPAEAQSRIDQAHSDARDRVRKLKGTYPLLGYGPDEWAISVAIAQTTESLAQVLQGQIIDLDKSIDATRERLSEDPDLVWQFDGLIEQVNAETGVEPNSD